MKKSYIITATALFMIGVFMTGSYLYKTQKNDDNTKLATQHRAALEHFHSPRMGSSNAKVTIVEFIDPACETCRLFHPYVKDLLEKHANQVNLVVRYAPFHQGSDYAIKMLLAAKQQGRFWDVLELMYDTQEGWASHHQPQPEKLWEYLDYYKFDTASMKKNMDNPTFEKIIAIDLADAKLLGANKTPTYFVNGKPLPSFGYEQLRSLVEQEISENY